MSQKLDRRQIEDNLAAYVLGALEPDEMMAMEESLAAADADLLEQLRALENATVHLARSAPPAPLPATAKEQLLSRAREGLAADAHQPPAMTHPAGSSEPPAWLRTLFARGTRGLGWAAVGALLAVLALWPALNSARSELARSQSEIAALRDEVAGLETSNATLQQINQGLESQLQTQQNQLAVVATSRARAPLVGTEAAPGAGGTLFFGDGQGVLVLQGLAPLSETETYQLWLIPEEGNALPLDLLSVETTAPSVRTISLPPDAATYANVGISVEPAGGSPAPTGPVVLIGGTS